MQIGQRKTSTGHRVSSMRRVHRIEGCRSADTSGGEWLTMSQAAAKFGVINHKIRRVVEAGLLQTGQIMPRAPYQIRPTDLEKPKSWLRSRKNAPVALKIRIRNPCYPPYEKEQHNEPGIRIVTIFKSM